MKNFITRTITGIGIVTLTTGVFFFLPAYAFSALLTACCIGILVFEWPQLGAWWLTPLYPIAPFGMLIFFNHEPTLRYLVLLTFCIAMLFDTFSYMSGKLQGKHRMAPIISPNKTWEGFAGGIFFTLFCSLPLVHHYAPGLTIVQSITIIIICCFCALMGGMGISWLKRRAQLKDTGSFLPGHGGLLDRFDSILAVGSVLFVTYYFNFY